MIMQLYLQKVGTIVSHCLLVHMMTLFNHDLNKQKFVIVFFSFQETQEKLTIMERKTQNMLKKVGP